MPLAETIRGVVEAVAARLSLVALVDVLLVAGAVYVLLKLIEGRRASQMAFGTLIVGGLLVVIGSNQFGLTTVQWIVRSTLPYLGIALIVLYQAEIRTGLARIGGGRFLWSRRRDQAPDRNTVSVLGDALSQLSRRRVGAIVVWQGKIGIKSYVDTGVSLDARMSAPLLVSLFQGASPLHDGAVVVRGDRVVAARCVLPLTRQEVGRGDRESPAYGTRHRAALGLTEETDAVVVVVSEETGYVSVVSRGRIVRTASRADLEVELGRARSPAEAAARPARHPVPEVAP